MIYGELGRSKSPCDSCQLSTFDETPRRRNIQNSHLQVVFKWDIKTIGNSLQYPYFRHASRSRLKLGKCPQAGCLQGGDEESEYGGEAYSQNKLLREGEDRLVDAVNPFAELKSA